MSSKVVFFVPYHTGYAHIEFIKSFSWYGEVYLFVYKWNPCRQLIEDYFSQSTNIHISEFNLENLLNEIFKQQLKQNRIVILLTSSINYLFGQTQYRLFNLIKTYFPILIDVYSTGHCMYGCQSCNHQNSYRLPITFTNYIRTKDFPLKDDEQFSDIILCPSFSSEQYPFSFLSNKDIIQTILLFSFSYLIKLHPLTYPNKYGQNPLFQLSHIEQENIDLLLKSTKNFIDEKQTNTLKLIEHARLIICDFDSSIPFETLYFNDDKYLFVYETIEQSIKQDDRRRFFHIFRNSHELNELIRLFFENKLCLKTKSSRTFFLEKYQQPDGNEIDYLANIRHWNTHLQLQTSTNSIDDFEQLKERIQNQFLINPTKIAYYVLGQHTQEQIEQEYFNDIDNEFKCLLENIDQI